MDLTEEEKKKKQAQSNLSTDELYNSNLKKLESDRQRQLEDAYVNQQLMNKYLGTKMANSGLSNTGAESLYYNNANANYRNEVGNINANYQNAQQDLLNQYYSNKKQEQEKADAIAREEAAKQEQELKERQDTLLSIYKDKIDNSKNDYQFLDDNVADQLYSSLDMEELGKNNYDYLRAYIDTLRGSEADIAKKTKDETYKSLLYKFYDGYANYENNYNDYLKEINDAYSSGNLSQDQYYETKSILDQYQQKQVEKYAQNYQQYLDSIYDKIENDNSITDEDYNAAIESIESIRKQIGEDNYINGIQALTAYKLTGDIIEKIDENKKMTSTEYNEIKAETEELYKSGKLSAKNYEDIIKTLDESKMSESEERAKARQTEADFYKEAMYNGTPGAEAGYWRTSDDPWLEKAARVFGEHVKKKFNETKEDIMNWWNNIWN